jgi:hypothetical protein
VYTIREATMKRRYFFVSILVATTTVSVLALGDEVGKDIYKGNTEARLDALAAIQPGLGTVMTEYGNRFTDAYYAAKGGNWGLAQYQVHEMMETQEVGETTRPNRADALKGFEEGYLAALQEPIKNKDFAAFEAAFKEAVGGCNGCHAGTGHAFVKYVLPKAPVEAYIDFNLKTEPKYKEEEE